MDLYFTTVTRSAPLSTGGSLVHVDWDTKRVRSVLPMVPTSPDVRDPNPRGGARGGRGVEVVGDRVLAATYHTLKVYDRTLEPQAEVTHGLMAGLHELCPSSDGRVWLAATGVDAALEVDLDRLEVVDARWPRDSEALRQQLGLAPLDIDKGADHRQAVLDRPDRSDPSHMHLNAVAMWRGQLHALCSHFGSIVNLDRNEVVLHDPRLRRAHNLHILDDGTALTSGTVTRSVEVWDLAAGRSRRTVPLQSFAWVRERTRSHVRRFNARRVAARLRVASPPTAHPLFIRGQHVDGDRVFVGLSPASIVVVDWRRGTLEDTFEYDESIDVAVHGIAVAP